MRNVKLALVATLAIVNMAFFAFAQAQPLRAGGGFGGDCDLDEEDPDYQACQCLEDPEFEVYNCDGFFEPGESDCIFDHHCEPD